MRERLAQSCYTEMRRPGFEPATCTDRKSSVLTTPLPSHATHHYFPLCFRGYTRDDVTFLLLRKQDLRPKTREKTGKLRLLEIYSSVDEFCPLR